MPLATRHKSPKLALELVIEAIPPFSTITASEQKIVNTDTN